MKVTTVEEDSSQSVEGMKDQNSQGKMKDVFSPGVGTHLFPDCVHHNSYFLHQDLNPNYSLIS